MFHAIEAGKSAVAKVGLAGGKRGAAGEAGCPGDSDTHDETAKKP